MGDGKRKSPESDGGGTVWASPCKSKPSPNQMGIVIGDGEAGRADDADPRTEDERDDPSRTAITGADADEGRNNRSVFLVAGCSDLFRVSKPYVVYKLAVAVAASAGASSSPSPVSRERGVRLKRGTRLKCSGGGKTFTSVRSPHRAWIVGVGGATGDTVVFDTETRKVIRGPDLKSPKWLPVLAAVGDKVYALARCPSWKDKSAPDFPPWFEVLDLEGAKVVVTHEGGDDDDDHLEEGCCSWKPLPIPPCLPWKMSPLEYTMLPIAVVWSYVVVSSYILVSFNQPWGTYAFDTNLDKWHKVDNEELPFVGCAEPLGGSIFLGLSDQRGGRINAYCISVTTSDKDDHALKLSISVLQVKYEGQELDVEPSFSSLENGCFCLPSFSLDPSIMIVKPEHGDCFPRKACVNLRTYQIDNRSLLEASSEETLRTMKQPVVVFSSQREQAFTVSSVHHGFSPKAFTFLSI